ncbi:MAG: SpoIID/LytB domain-containing protein [Candidatus Krumholzibacteria bacterium]|jgi:stage II sporulation protein D|nr:SpoIID/LytB domain-containing protein [Candidatus Krumholzibacteria bacterium]MDP6797191.1 SpoIID/LytB domain-containing protein [Candidatus Krumholzibacteria bacterium]MDP7021904.1 SpoIID/LytB domain-containing protein [Candidatus Krumholzibacteria bacterium]
MIRRLVLIALPLLLACSSKPPLPPGEISRENLDREPEMRVLLVQSVNALELRASRGLVIRNAKGQILGRLKGRKSFHFFQNPKSPRKLRVYEEKPSRKKLRKSLLEIPFRSKLILETRPGSELQLNGKRYRGRIVLLRRGKHFHCINYIPVEEYLEGVVPHEIGHLGRKGMAAMKAQAVASRTYAVQRLQERKKADWDMVDTVSDQVYRGAGGGSRLATRAVRQTRGELLALGSNPAEIYYSSTCGGHTVAIDDAWNHAPVPHLGAVRDEDEKGRSWCSSSRYFRWTHSWSAKELGEILRAYLPRYSDLREGSDIGHLRDVRILEYSQDGRIRLLEVSTDRGSFPVKGDRIRSVLKRNLRGTPLRSTMFRLKKERNQEGQLLRVTAFGAGWGHGIGLCQVGAINRSKAGQSYREILEAYYPGTGLRRFWP